MAKKVDILGLLPGKVRDFRRCSPDHVVYTMNDFYNYINIAPDRIYELHTWLPPYYNHWRLWDKDITYNHYAPSLGVWVNPAMNHNDLSSDLRHDFDFTIIDRFGGPKNFLTSMSYMVAHAVEEGAEEIHLHCTFYITGEEYQQQLPSFLSLLHFIEDHYPAVKFTTVPEQTMKMWQLFEEGWMKFDGENSIKAVATKESAPIINHMNNVEFPRPAGQPSLIEIIRTNKKISDGLPELPEVIEPYHLTGVAVLLNEKWPAGVRNPYAEKGLPVPVKKD